jgi:hypothetical protein
VFQPFRQHRFGFATQEARHPSAHRDRTDSTYLHRSDRVTADYSDKEMHAALDINIPNYAIAIVTTKEVVDSIFSA